MWWAEVYSRSRIEIVDAVDEDACLGAATDERLLCIVTNSIV